MKIVIDTSCLHVSQAGVPRYTRGLVRGLTESAQPGQEVRTIEFGISSIDNPPPQRVLVTALREGVWGPYSAPMDIMQMGSDLLHSPHPPIIRTQHTPHVVTLHDLAVIQTPERYRRWHRWSGARRVTSLHRHDLVVCISEFTANLAMEMLELNARQIRVIPNGCNFVDPEPLQALHPEDSVVDGDYFLFVGSLEPGKNLQLLIDTWNLARQRGIELPPLAVVGARWEGVPAEANAPKDWHYLGHVPDTELVYLYQHARGLLFPSTYEGWGLPIVEAMALGCPVVASPLTAIPEAAGDAALLIDQSPETWLESIQFLMRDANREPLIAKGRQHAAQFTWKRMGESLWEAYEDVLEQRSLAMRHAA